jgi:hypothetical protein
MASAFAYRFVGVTAFTVAPCVVAACALILLTSGCCGLVRPRRFAVLSAAAAFAALTWATAAAVKWGSALLGDAVVALLKEGSRLTPYTTGDFSAEFYVLAAPFCAAVALGCYALLTVGAKLYRFNDCEEAADELTEVRFRCCCGGGAPVTAGAARESGARAAPPSAHTSFTSASPFSRDCARRRTWRRLKRRCGAKALSAPGRTKKKANAYLPKPLTSSISKPRRCATCRPRPRRRPRRCRHRCRRRHR